MKLYCDGFSIVQGTTTNTYTRIRSQKPPEPDGEHRPVLHETVTNIVTGTYLTDGRGNCVFMGEGNHLMPWNGDVLKISSTNLLFAEPSYGTGWSGIDVRLVTLDPQGGNILAAGHLPMITYWAGDCALSTDSAGRILLTADTGLDFLYAAFDAQPLLDLRRGQRVFPGQLLDGRVYSLDREQAYSFKRDVSQIIFAGELAIYATFLDVVEWSRDVLRKVRSAHP